MIRYVKREAAVFAVTFLFFVVGGWLYFSQNVDIGETKERVSSLRSEISSLRKRMGEVMKEKKRNDEFLASHGYVTFVKSPKLLGQYGFEKRMKEIMSSFFGRSASFSMNEKPKRRGDYLVYDAVCLFPYTNRERVRSFFEFLSKYMIKTKRVSFSGGKFRIECEFLGKR